jgi:hypothetical protein
MWISAKGVLQGETLVRMLSIREFKAKERRRGRRGNFSYDTGKIFGGQLSESVIPIRSDVSKGKSSHDNPLRTVTPKAALVYVLTAASAVSSLFFPLVSLKCSSS